MARYTQNFQLQGDSNQIWQKAFQYLTSEGYTYVTYETENVFLKETGDTKLIPFIKLSFGNGFAQLQAWTKSPILNREQSVVGRAGANLSEPRSQVVTCVENILMGQEPLYGISEVVAQGPNNHISSYVSKNEYRRKYAPKWFNKSINTTAIICYVAIAIWIVLAIVTQQYIIGTILDVVIYGGLVLGIHIGKSKVCAIILLVFSCLSILLCLILYGELSGWLWPLFALSALSSIQKIDREYKLGGYSI